MIRVCFARLRLGRRSFVLASIALAVIFFLSFKVSRPDSPFDLIFGELETRDRLHILLPFLWLFAQICLIALRCRDISWQSAVAAIAMMALGAWFRPALALAALILCLWPSKSVLSSADSDLERMRNSGHPLH
ncbi:MAG: hypothetical protein EP341_00170 [Sphingomonadales bacterium]|nr:MAG: hypothetical protein EP341_00170 [Sphingomonadales bacterium]